MSETVLRNKLNEQDVLDMRNAYRGPQRRGLNRTGPTLQELADQYGVSAAQICRIMKNKCWVEAKAA